MFFTLAGNRRRIEDAAAKARAEGIAIGRAKALQESIAIGRAEVLQESIAIGRAEVLQESIAIGRAEVLQESIAIGRAEARRQARQEIAEWYEAAKAEVAAGRIPGPPPILLENSGNNAPY